MGSLGSFAMLLSPQGFCVLPKIRKRNPHGKALEIWRENPWRKKGPGVFAEMLPSKIGQQLGHPTQSLLGWMVKRFLLWHNEVLEKNAVRLCGIQPDDTVLEVGFGPGLGLEFAATLLSGPRGKLFGVDYSEFMYKLASKRVQGHIASGKVTLYEARVEAMPLPDSIVDKVFHCNCYYFWPDLRAGTAEIHRVMKPGGQMMTTLIAPSVEIAASLKILSGENWHPEAYIDALRATGFTDIRMEDKKDKRITYQAIFATASK